MLYNKLPFKGKDKNDLIKNICKKPVEFPNLEDRRISRTVRGLILSMLEKDPKERIIMNDCLEHKWFKMTEQEIEDECKEVIIELYVTF
jgi:serine/threonine protein kinase